MTELRVPTITVDVSVVYAGGEHLDGRIFLPALAHRHEGPTRADEWINDTMPFFPFLENGKQRAGILNKDRVVVLTVPVEAVSAGSGDVFPTARVRVECAGEHFEGLFRIDMPEAKARVQDYLNQPSRFAALFEGESVRLIRKIFIDHVVEIRED